ncbi:GDA1/CD39 nucleoside phosphatase family protein [Rhynchospora pubera]|uniref:GDA1/CD39 nucleoside phosphatase family protein n=1 Tax=Rhynchospora pubera TaxID=906938 RepID=A0AAV8CDJ1_9POAL|nr:GDA1/CD39 nucleoside phosphatase family protein [Rhynchospora pubera]
MAMIDRYKTPRRSPSPTRLPQKPRTTIVLALLTTALILLFLSFSPFRTNPTPGPLFSVIIDAGSSGSRIHVFAFSQQEGSLPLLDLNRTAVLRTSPGLSSFVDEPVKAGDSLEELLWFAKQNVGQDSVGSTEIRLMATAGLRLVDGDVREKVLESCRGVLRESGFKFEDDWASVIPGYDEGLYAWTAANYALGKLGGDLQKTIGIIELGGASAQLTFVSDEVLPTEYMHILKLGKTTYNLYSNSFLHFGQNSAEQSLHELLKSGSIKSTGDPCMPKGYSYEKEMLEIKGTGNFTECQSVSFDLLRNGKENCTFQECRIGSAFVPDLQGHFLATENFFFTSKFFKLDRKSPLSHISSAGEKFCGEDWVTLKERYSSTDEEELSRYCFSSAYIVAFLHDSLGIPMDATRIEFANEVGDIQAEWALGAFIVQRMASISKNSASIFKSTLAPVFLILSLSLFIYLSVAKYRRPQTKTIYDLEKGRYIVTRVA